MEYSSKSTTIFSLKRIFSGIGSNFTYNITCNERVSAEYEVSRFFEKIPGPKVIVILKFSTIKIIDKKVDYHWNLR